MARVREKKTKVKIKCQSCSKSFPISEWHKATESASGGRLNHRLPYVRGISVRCPGCGYNQNVNRCSRTMTKEGKELDGYYVTT
jgi:ribosomal protein S27E